MTSKNTGQVQGGKNKYNFIRNKKHVGNDYDLASKSKGTI
ncbi:MAG: hypothetical protein ACJARD_000950 [Alphaproteobacteria bacterium]|jgi:hypothetical protein